MIITPTRQLNILDTTDPWTQPGVISLTDGSYLFGYTHDIEPGTMFWLRSTNEGTSWSNVGSGRGTGNGDVCLATHAPGSIAVYPQFDYAYDSAHILRSTNLGATWTIVATFDSAESDAWSCFAVCSCSLRNGARLIVGGQFQGSNSAAQELIAISDNFGATWTPSNALTSDGDGSYCAALAAGGDDTVYAVVRHFADLVYTPELWISTDGGATWSSLGNLPLTTNASGAAINSMSAVRNDWIVIAGEMTGNDNPTDAAVWYSHDGGTTINLVAAADIINFPSGLSYAPNAYEAKRLTADAVLLTFETGGGAAGPFFAVSLDGGITYEVAPNAPASGWENWQFPTGAAVVTRTGKILIPVFRWPDFGESYHQVYQCTVTC